MSPIKNMNTEYVLNRSKIQHQKAPNKASQKTPSFDAVLNRIQTQDAVKFSKHALQRLNNREVALSDQEVARLNEGVHKAKRKGVREALIMMDNKVFVASVRNNTIITAAVDEQLKEGVFTNIDGAVIV